MNECIGGGVPFEIEKDETVGLLLRLLTYQSPAVEADHQRTFLSSCFQNFRHQDINTDLVLIDDFIASAVNVEGGELFGIQCCGGEGHSGRKESPF